MEHLTLYNHENNDNEDNNDEDYNDNDDDYDDDTTIILYMAVVFKDYMINIDIMVNYHALLSLV